MVKRHEGVHREFTFLAKDDPAIDKGFPPFLTRAYNMKAIADYDLEFKRDLKVYAAQQGRFMPETKPPALSSRPNMPPTRWNRNAHC